MLLSAARRCSASRWPLPWHRFAHAAPQRDPGFGQLTDTDVDFFQKILGSSGVVTDTDALVPFNVDWQNKYKGRSSVALRPRTTQQVSELLRYCSSRRLAVVPQGGNTGLVGGSVPVFDEVVLSTGAMNQVLSFDEVSGVLVAQAGCVLQALDEHVSARGYIMPLDLGAKGSCQVGGNVSTNAGGLRLLRYGSLHGSVLGLEAVLPDGTVLDLLRTLRKDNTGYDLKQLFIGAEGTLGVVTAVAVQCAPRPRSVQLAFLACPSFEHVTAALRTARTTLYEILSAIEFLDERCMRMATVHLEGVRNPLAGAGEGQGGVGAEAGEAGDATPFYMLVETHGSDPEHDRQKMERFLEAAMEQGCVTDGTLSQSEAQARAIWRVREGIAEALARRGAVYKYDVSLPTAHMYDMVQALRRRLEAAGWGEARGVQVVGYGHIGDGNLHLNISAPSYDPALLSLIEPYVYEYVSSHAGSISAEHGLGLMKAGALHYSKGPEAVALMRGIKQLVDPHGILNPYKVLPTP